MTCDQERHFVQSGSPVTCDIQSDQNGTVLSYRIYVNVDNLLNAYPC